jgi:hypothetical protein
LTRRPVTDPTSGFYALGPRAMRLLSEHHPTGYAEPELRLLLCRNELAVVEVPVEPRPRLAGRTSLTRDGSRQQGRAWSWRCSSCRCVPAWVRPEVSEVEIDRIQIIAIVMSAAFLLGVLELVRRRKLVEEYSFLWIGVATLMLAISIWRELLHSAARELGVHDPPNVLLIALTAAVVLALLGISVILSRQRRQIRAADRGRIHPQRRSQRSPERKRPRG